MSTRQASRRKTRSDKFRFNKAGNVCDLAIETMSMNRTYYSSAIL